MLNQIFGQGQRCQVRGPIRNNFAGTTQ